ncbi:protein of unknown function [Parasphingorhabdus marina DSM 22363]|uniref:DUF5655 domain-containing protein n=1 Tax=Parasphingorhabdus marina DSM 22363 TaxID=1123272 RepID=A0A1N6D6D6_9SPHN|nr:DUF4287 domain-containing protein [Parasphingorhabdus marina]SIN66256.1 protein of unknown function [Parasphingorhabdus marina DSM 22363]
MATPEEMAQSMIANMPEKTGKALEDWLKIVHGTGMEKHGQIVKYLKTDHGMTHGFANLVASKALNPEPVGEADLVTAQYGGAKAGLKPIHDAVVAFAQTLGADVEIAPKKASVSLRRSKQFALITPATKSRVDLGLALKGEKAEGRLESYNAMCSHRVRLENVDDLDDDVKAWMQLAYERS